MFSITEKTYEQYTKPYIRLIGLEFGLKNVKRAKEYYAQIYKKISLDLTDKQWIPSDDVILVQIAPLHKTPEKLIRHEFDKYLTLVFMVDSYVIKDKELIKLIDDSVKDY